MGISFLEALFPTSLVKRRCFSSTLGFPEIQIGSPIVTNMDSLVELLDHVEFFLKSSLFFLPSKVGKAFQQ